MSGELQISNIRSRLYCLGMGRPACIQEYNITTTKPKAQDVSISFLSEEEARISQPYPTSHITENVIHMCELLMITSEVIDQLYAKFLITVFKFPLTNGPQVCSALHLD